MGSTPVSVAATDSVDEVTPSNSISVIEVTGIPHAFRLMLIDTVPAGVSVIGSTVEERGVDLTATVDVQFTIDLTTAVNTIVAAWLLRVLTKAPRESKLKIHGHQAGVNEVEVTERLKHAFHANESQHDQQELSGRHSAP